MGNHVCTFEVRNYTSPRCQCLNAAELSDKTASSIGRETNQSVHVSRNPDLTVLSDTVKRNPGSCTVAQMINTTLYLPDRHSCRSQAIRLNNIGHLTHCGTTCGHFARIEAALVENLPDTVRQTGDNLRPQVEAAKMIFTHLPRFTGFGAGHASSVRAHSIVTIAPHFFTLELV